LSSEKPEQEEVVQEIDNSVNSVSEQAEEVMEEATKQTDSVLPEE